MYQVLTNSLFIHLNSFAHLLVAVRLFAALCLTLSPCVHSVEGLLHRFWCLQKLFLAVRLCHATKKVTVCQGRLTSTQKSSEGLLTAGP